MAFHTATGRNHSGHAATRPPDDPNHGSIEGSQAAPPHSSPLFSTPPRPPHRQSVQRGEGARSERATLSSGQQQSQRVPPTYRPDAAISASNPAYTDLGACQQTALPPASSPLCSMPAVAGASHSAAADSILRHASGEYDQASPIGSPTYLSDEDGSYSSSEEHGAGSRRGRPENFNLPRWTRRESELLRSGYARHGQKWEIVAKEVEAAGGRQRSVASYSAHFHRLRHKGFIDVNAPGAVGKGRLGSASQSNPQRTISASGTSTPRVPFFNANTAEFVDKKRPEHKWTNEEREFLLRAGEKYCVPGARGKQAALYAAWKKRFPTSQLTAHIVYVYWDFMKKKLLEQQGGSGSACSTPSKSAAGPSTLRYSTAHGTASSYPAHLPRSTAATYGRISASKSHPLSKGKLWDAAEVQALERCHRMLVAQGISWRGTSALYDTYRKIIPRTQRSPDAVRAKYISLFEQDQDDSDESGSMEDSEGEAHEGDGTMLTPPHMGDASGYGTLSSAASLKADIKPFAKHQHYADSYLPGAQSSAPLTVYTANTSFNHSFPPAATSHALPTLNVLTSVTPEGLLFENAHAGLGIAVFGPRSFKLLGPQQMAALPQLPIDEQPAFALNVLEGGAIQMVNMPEGTTTSMRVIPAGEGGRMGVESKVSGPDGYTLVIVVWI